ncbi:MAG: DUF1236 domain-containing protein [Xanthobacteraceae bacterium]
MPRHILQAAALTLALAGAILPASAQQQPGAKPPNQNSGPDAGTQPNAQVPGPNALTPGAASTSTDASTMAQPVPGAMPGSAAVPSTMSERNAASDKLAITAFTFKNLTPQQRQAIYQALKGKPAAQAFNADIGMVLPSQVALDPVPNDVARQVPQTEGYHFTVTADRVLLVSGANRYVVGVLTGKSHKTDKK